MELVQPVLHKLFVKMTTIPQSEVNELHIKITKIIGLIYSSFNTFG